MRRRRIETMLEMLVQPTLDTARSFRSSTVDTLAGQRAFFYILRVALSDGIGR